MTRRALSHAYPRWEPPEDDPYGDPCEVWVGRMRIVSPRRARTLRRRGVPLLPLHVVDEHGRPRTPDGRARYAWFEEC